MPRAKGLQWKYFVEDEEDFTFVKCLECSAKVSRGKTGSTRGQLNSTGMKNHIKKCHPEYGLCWKLRRLRMPMLLLQQRIQEKDETAKSTVQIFNIRTAEEKEIFYRQVVPEVPTPDTTYDYENMKAKKWHKSVLAQIFLDLESIFLHSDQAWVSHGGKAD